jgi:hypothetical protein
MSRAWRLANSGDLVSERSPKDIDLYRKELRKPAIRPNCPRVNGV